MGVLEQQSIRREVGNRRLGRRRLEARLRGETDERRRPARGARRGIQSIRKRAHRDRGSRFANSLAGLGRGIAVTALLPLQLFVLMLRPRDFIQRLRALPARIESGARRLRMASHNPETRTGRLWDTAVLSAHFLREEVADMQDGFPSRAEFLADITGSASVVRGGVERMLNRFDDSNDQPLERALQAAGVGVIAGTVVVGLFVAGHGTLEAVSQSNGMVVQTVLMEGASRTSEDVLLEQVGLVVGDPLLHLDLVTAAAAVEALPWVAEATVTTDLRERALRIQVVEHRAALVLSHDGLKLVDDQGLAFKRLNSGDPADLPVLTGLESLEALDTEEARQVLAGALDVLHSLAGSGPVSRPTVSEIRWEGDDGWSITTRDGLPVRLGRKDFGERLGRLERAIARGGLPLSAIASIDVGLRDRLVVVPKKTKKAKRTVVQAVKAQPVPARDRSAHLERIRRSLGSAGEG
jgi:cell division protein FtsQ